MSKIIHSIINYSRATLTIFLVMFIVGIVGIKKIPKEFLPSVQIPYIIISVPQVGILPKDAESEILKTIEQNIRSVEGVKEIKGVALSNFAQIIIEFNMPIDINKALADVRAQVDVAKADLPADAEEPFVDQINLSQFPVVSIAISSNMDEHLLSKFAQDLSDQILQIPNVLNTSLMGSREEMAEVILEPNILNSYKISASDLFAAISNNNLVIPSGSLNKDVGSFVVKIPSLFKSVEDISKMPIKADGDAIVRFKDILSVNRSFQERTNIARVGGKNTIVLEVVKRPDANIIETVAQVRYVLKQAEDYLPKDLKGNVTFTVMQDNSKLIVERINDLVNNIILSVLAVFVILYFGMGFRTAIISAISMPMTFIISFALFNAYGFVLNMMVLFALVLSTGLLIDATIVIIEYAVQRMAAGASPKEAYAESASRMFWPLFSSTLTTVIVFVPLMFWPGISGDFMGFLPKTLIIVLSVSLVVANIFIPIIGGKIAKAQKNVQAVSGGIKPLDDLLREGGFLGKYSRFLNKVLNNAGFVVIVLSVIVLLTFRAYQVFSKGVEFFPSAEPDLMELKIYSKGNLSLEEKDKIVKEVEDTIPKTSEIKSIYAKVEDTNTEDTIGSFIIEMNDWNKRRRVDEIFKKTREKLKQIPGIKAELREQEQGPSSGKAFSVQILAINNKDLEGITRKVTKYVTTLDGLYNVSNDMPSDNVDLKIVVDNDAANKVGVDTKTIGSAIQMVTNGLKIGEYKPDYLNDSIDIRVFVPEQYRLIDYIYNIQIFTQKGFIPLGNLIKIKPERTDGYIRHINLHRAYKVEADVKNGADLGVQVKKLMKFVKDNHLEQKATFKLRGEQEDRDENVGFLSEAFLVALFAIMFILLVQFNSFFYSFLILSAVIFSTIGSLLGLVILQMPFDIIMSGLGIIFLAGIVVNNNIVLIDTYIDMKKNNPTLSVRHLLILACSSRFRAVLLTSITTVLGLMPMALKVNIDFIHRGVYYNSPSNQYWQQLSVAIVMGMIFSTVLTLIITPTIIYLRENKMAETSGRKRGVFNQLQSLFTKALFLSKRFSKTTQERTTYGKTTVYGKTAYRKESIFDRLRNLFKNILSKGLKFKLNYKRNSTTEVIKPPTASFRERMQNDSIARRSRLSEMTQSSQNTYNRYSRTRERVTQDRTRVGRYINMSQEDRNKKLEEIRKRREQNFRQR